MGHIPTIVVSALASALTGLYFVFPDTLHLTLTVFIAASWFLAAICWLAQKSADYMHNMGEQGHEKKNLMTTSHSQQTVQISSSQLDKAKSQLNAELDELRKTVKNKDDEIENLKKEISNLQTLVQIEALKVELANLKTLAAKEDTKNKKK